MTKMLEAVECCDMNNLLKEEWKKRIENGLEICQRDRQNFITEEE